MTDHGTKLRTGRRPRWWAPLVTLALVASSPPPAAALCGDATGDGFITAADALATLRGALTGSEQPRLDTAPPERGDGAVTASDALATLVAAVQTRIPGCAAAVETTALVSTAPPLFDSGGIAVVDVETWALRFRSGALHRDSVARTAGGRALGLNRFGANSLQQFDVAASDLATDKECSVSDGFNSNPHDVAIADPTKGYVTLYEAPHLLVIDPRVLDDPADPACTELIRGRVDLSSAADDDGVPEMDQMALVGDRLFVLLQILEHSGLFDPAGNARIAVVDTTDDALAATIELELTNPFAETKGIVYDPLGERLYVGGPGVIFDDFDDGGIERVDPATLRSEGVLVSGADLGGDLFDFVIAGTRRAFAVLAYADETNAVVQIDLANRRVTQTLVTSTEPITDIELTERGQLWVATRESGADAAPGIRIFDIGAAGAPTERTDTPLFPGSRPFTIAFLDESASRSADEELNR